MNKIWLLVLVFFNSESFSFGNSVNVTTRPNVVNIGAIFSFNSTVGKVAKVAIEAAVDDVNSEPAVLNGTKLKLTMQDTNYSGFLGIVEGKSFY